MNAHDDHLRIPALDDPHGAHKLVFQIVRRMTWDHKLSWAKEQGIWEAAREDARAELEERLRGTGHGISSGDINHVAMQDIERRIINELVTASGILADALIEARRGEER